MKPQYSIVIQWSDEDKKYIVSLPEFGPYAHTHGNTYADALNNAEEVLELLIEDYQAQGKPLPKPLTANVSLVETLNPELRDQKFKTRNF